MCLSIIRRHPIRKKRIYIEGALYHITSRTNNKQCVFGRRLGRKIMMLVLKEAKQKYGFRLLNFCIMPTHIHLLISPGNHADIPAIMRWIKTKTAKWWNHIHGATDHLWGERFFPRPVLGLPDYLRVMAYIDNNPVKAGLASRIGDYKDSGAFHIREGIKDIVDYSDFLTNFYPRALIAGR